MRKDKRDRYRTGEMAFSPKEVEALLHAAPSREDELVLLMGLGTGLRREDMAEVLIRNINLQEGTLLFHEHKKDRRAKGYRSRRGRFHPGKVIEEAWRTIPLTPKLQEAIRKYLPMAPSNVRLFPMTGRTLYNRLRYTCDKAGIPRRPFHALRATMIKGAQRAGWPPEAVAKLTGDRLDTIQAHYTVPSEAEMRELAAGKELIP
jgi:integrase